VSIKIWATQQHAILKSLPIISSRGRGDADDGSVEIQLPQAWIFVPNHLLQLWSLGLSDGNVVGMCGAFLKIDHVGDRNEVKMKRVYQGLILEEGNRNNGGGRVVIYLPSTAVAIFQMSF
jgi:hypothetical protein